jgi:hypothetical protein
MAFVLCTSSKFVHLWNLSVNLSQCVWCRLRNISYLHEVSCRAIYLKNGCVHILSAIARQIEIYGSINKAAMNIIESFMVIDKCTWICLPFALSDISSASLLKILHGGNDRYISINLIWITVDHFLEFLRLHGYDMICVLFIYPLPPFHRWRHCLLWLNDKIIRVERAGWREQDENYTTWLPARNISECPANILTYKRESVIQGDSKRWTQFRKSIFQN